MKRYGLLLLFAPFLLFAVGALSQLAVERSNHDMMPVHSHCDRIGPLDDNHICETPETHLKFLDDRIVLEPIGVYSIGDVFLWLAEVGTIPFPVLWLGLVLAKELK